MRDITGKIGVEGGHLLASGAFSSQVKKDRQGAFNDGGDRDVASFDAKNVVPVSIENRPASVSVAFLVSF